MEIRSNTSAEFSMKKRITGSSVINHSVRVELKLSLEEYVLLDFIFNWNQKSDKEITFPDYYRETGFIKDNIVDLFQVVKEKRLLIMDLNKKRVDVSETWKAIFSSDGAFNQLWKTHPKGNKNAARLKMSKVLKKISIQELADKLTKYIQWCDHTNTFKKDLATWLNPELEHWNNILDKKNFVNNKPITISQIKFKNGSQ